ncbi:MAG: ATP-binding protein [Bacteroidales bacterium]|jgi:NadR type nicotinamide-nucleotide adenylyltransferase|nr:ATP-binding protein [Bacteroidales bacterium]
MFRILRVAVTGPESTGKSELAEALAKHFNTVWVPEYSREYLESIKRPYTYMDILAIARRQFEKEGEMIRQASKMIFCDTEFIVTKIWCDEKFGKCHPWILEMIDKVPYDLYLLCDTDLPWESDPLRENPDDRDRLLKRYKTELISRNLPYVLVSGNGSARIQLAIDMIMQHINPKI